jgi:6-phosphogluconolactonase (cycloisomerase 2 family)
MAMKFRLLLSFVLVLSTMWTIGCGHYTCGTTFGNATCTPSGGGISGGGGGGNTISQTAFVYFMDDTSAEMALEGLNVANSQTFAPIPTFVSPTFPVNTLGANGGIAIVNKNFLYLPFANGSLYGFSIDAATGALSPVPNPVLTLSGSGETIAADPNGAVLFVGVPTGISTFTVNANDGSLTPIGTTTTGSTPSQIATDGLGKYVYALTGTTITAFAYTSSGVLTPVTNSPFPISMAQIAGEASGKFLFGITAENGGGSGAIDNHIYVFSIASGGGLTTFGSPVPTLSSPVYLAVSPNGKFVYTFDQTSDIVSTVNDPMEGFAFSTGTLTELGTSPFAGLDASVGKFDQSGQYIFAIADVPNSSLAGEYAYAVDASGAVTSNLPHAGAVNAGYAVTDEP